jgi:hypothetical protein
VTIGRVRSFRPVCLSHSDQPLHAPTAQSTCRRLQYDPLSVTAGAVRGARLHDACSSAARGGLLGAATLRAAMFWRDIHRSLPRTLAEAARCRALAPRPPLANLAHDRAVLCASQHRANAAFRRGLCDDLTRAMFPAGVLVALGPAAPLTDGAVDLPVQISWREPMGCFRHSGTTRLDCRVESALVGSVVSRSLSAQPMRVTFRNVSCRAVSASLSTS